MERQQIFLSKKIFSPQTIPKFNRLEATKDVLNGDVKPVPKKKAKNVFQFHLFDSNDKEVRSNGSVFVELPVPEGMKAPFKLTVSDVPTTFEETDHGTVSFAVLIK